VIGPVLVFGSGSLGSYADEGVAGDIGNGLLRRFVVTFDYQQKMMYLRPATDLSVPESFDRSGLELGASVKGSINFEVMRGSPADLAGLKSGDALIAVDGRPVAQWTLKSLSAALSGAPGTKVRLTVRPYKKGPRTVLITLRDYV
jgi:C-terminal processing protease CtpA/Prc